MVTLSVLQFVLLLVTIIALTGWFMTKLFLLACTEEKTFKKILLLAWVKNPDVIQSGMQWLLTQEEADTMVQKIVGKITIENAKNLNKNCDADGNCRYCGQMVATLEPRPVAPKAR